MIFTHLSLLSELLMPLGLSMRLATDGFFDIYVHWVCLGI